jgi:hypothetical protein
MGTNELVEETRVQRRFIGPAGLEVLDEANEREGSFSSENRRLRRSETNLVVLLQALPVLFEFRVAVVPDFSYSVTVVVQGIASKLRKK